MRHLFTTCVLILLAACGFQPRGQITLAPPLKNMYLKAEDPYGELARNIQSYLKMSGVHLTENPQSADTCLVILSERIGQDLVSVSGTQLTRQYNLTLSVTYEVTNSKGVILIAPQTSTEVRSLTIQSDQILGGSNEATASYTQMRQAIVYDIMSRLGSKEITRLLRKKKT